MLADLQGTPHALHNVRELERGEGAALHAHLFEELLDWSELQRKHHSMCRTTPH
jgi:hypothetical protein